MELGVYIACSTMRKVPPPEPHLWLGSSVYKYIGPSFACRLFWPETYILRVLFAYMDSAFENYIWLRFMNIDTHNLKVGGRVKSKQRLSAPKGFPSCGLGGIGNLNIIANIWLRHLLRSCL